ncbi:hypothetical protein [Parasitella parasitica]|uniref:Uncharacterized protein n=1 Tax=Parasitella parasitica TaxID=35722 RepID=A0A0B7NWV6_9FUNG|nr:hypothetical protein [Parasitella parasitica]
MDNFNNSFNVTMQALQLISEAYTFCYVNLQKSNIPLPAPDQVMATARTTVSYILSNSPAFIRQLYGMISQMIIESNIMGILLLLVILYVFYCVIMGIFKWIYRLVYGFVRFSVILLLIGTGLYFANMYISNSTSTFTETTKSYR